jgi:hypothetical protein
MGYVSPGTLWEDVEVHRVRFARRQLPGVEGLPYAAVDVFIDDERLDLLWAAKVDDAVLPLSVGEVLTPGHRMWLGEPPIDSFLVEEGRVAVLTCSCGNFGCGGAVAQIEFTRGVVRWRDFHSANLGPPADVGPFEFRRGQYQAAFAELDIHGGSGGT